MVGRAEAVRDVLAQFRGVALLVARSVDAAVVAVVAYYVTQQLFAGVVADLAALQGR